jgi:hypothetical protein
LAASQRYIFDNPKASFKSAILGQIRTFLLNKQGFQREFRLKSNAVKRAEKGRLHQQS